MRNLEDVIVAVIALIPPDDPLGMIAPLTDMKESVSYAPPENMDMWWGEVADLLQLHLPFPLKEEWQRNVYREFTQAEPPEGSGMESTEKS